MGKSTARYLALLRGINVGGKNIIGKDELKHCFEELGFASVRTYIQSGNILFRSDERSVKRLTAAVESGLTKRFRYEAQAVVLSQRKYELALESAPASWGNDQDAKHNALFTLASITPKRVLTQLPAPKPDIETVTVGPGVIFWSISKKYQTRTTLMRLSKDPVYQQLTIRNHNTVFKLAELFEQV